MANYTTINVERRYLDGVTMAFIVVKNEAKHIYLELNAWNYSNSRNWGHKSNIYGRIGDASVNAGDFKIVYYNRTWECYRFQSVLHKAFYSCGLDKKVDKKLYDTLWKKIDEKARKVL